MGHAEVGVGVVSSGVVQFSPQGGVGHKGVGWVYYPGMGGSCCVVPNWVTPVLYV